MNTKQSCNNNNDPLQKLASLAHDVIVKLQSKLDKKQKNSYQVGIPPLIPFGGVLIPLTPQRQGQRLETTPFSVVSKEELGRSTWTFLHSLAAQFPEYPSKQQQKDAYQLIQCMTRIYPCAECATHFQEIVKNNPPRVCNGKELRQWTCEVHNTVNRSLGKPVFNCSLIESRWAALDCDDKNACDLTIGSLR
eukprot:TRINITY_DN10485_c1_g1_i2.p2 TRINITY_DN10485_c1_g1~~TRINITY_DN10485_c1_g1_i2.p2  ORF type:complete len:216 (-),score=9.78 TRINITY_DN10485_c1_g1_i2:775-1350(-)